MQPISKLYPDLHPETFDIESLTQNTEHLNFVNNLLVIVNARVSSTYYQYTQSPLKIVLQKLEISAINNQRKHIHDI